MSEFRSIGEVLGILETEFRDITVSKIRFLESQGLLKPARTAAGYRQFSEADITQLRWVLTQQRDSFMPLRVLRERIASGDWEHDEPVADTVEGEPQIAPASSVSANDETAAPTPSATAPEPPTSASTPGGVAEADVSHGPIDLSAGPNSYSLDDVARLSSLDTAAVRELMHYGIIEVARDEPTPVFDDDTVVIAKAASAFMAHGVEPRHLRGWRTSADREASLLEQLTIPLLRQGSPVAVEQAMTTAAELVSLGGELRYALLRRALRASLGQSSTR